MRRTGRRWRRTGMVGIVILLISVLLCGFQPGNQNIVAKAASVTYTVKPGSTPYQKIYETSGTYNSKTRQYYMLRSYLELLEKQGGGKLVLTKGTYVITNTLNVPSKVTLLLKDGVKLIKGNDSGTRALVPSKTMFQLIAPSKAGKSAAVSGYQGEQGIKIIGEGSAVIDLDFTEGAIGIMFGHNTDVTVSGINFRNMYGGHFIELDASQDILIENNTFQDHKASASGIKEAINLDTPDINTGGFHAIWTSYDCTPNLEVVIQKNTFRNLERAIGTHKYSEGRYHENIKLLNNTIENTTSDAIRIMNWKRPVLIGNSITDVNAGQGTGRAILVSGVIHPEISGNFFTDVPRPIQLMPWKNTDAGSEYAITYNEVSTEEINTMLGNYLRRVGEPFIRVNRTYGVYTSDTLKYYYPSEYLK